MFTYFHRLLAKPSGIEFAVNFVGGKILRICCEFFCRVTSLFNTKKTNKLLYSSILCNALNERKVNFARKYLPLFLHLEKVFVCLYLVAYLSSYHEKAINLLYELAHELLAICPPH